VGEGAPRGNREAVVASKGSGNGKLWLIIGGGVAALFLLIAAALFLVKKPSETDNNVQVAKKEKEMAILVDRLFKVGEPKANAEKIAARVGEVPVLNELPIYVQRLKEGFENLGKKDLSPEELSKELEAFINTTNDIQIREVASEGSLSDLLLKSLQQIKELKGKDDGQKTDKSAGELLLALKKSLGGAAEFNKPEWLEKEGIDRIYLTLWELEYQNLVDNLLNGTNAVTVQEVDQFMDIRYANDETLVPDSTIEEIHGRLGEDKLKKYAAKVNAENPKLLKKFLLPAPIAEDKDKIAATSPDKDEPKPGNNPPVKASKLEDEEWWYGDFEPEGEKVSIKISGSEILHRISETKDPQNAAFSFGEAEVYQVVLNDAYTPSKTMIDFEGSETINFTSKSNALLFKTPLKIFYNGKQLIIHLGEWPSLPVSSDALAGELDPVIAKGEWKPATYSLSIKGDGLRKLEKMQSRTVPKLSLDVLNPYGKGTAKFMSGGKILIEKVPPSGIEFNPPPAEISEILEGIFKNVWVEGEGGKPTLKQEKENNETYEKSWSENGWVPLQNDEGKSGSIDWINKAIKTSMGKKGGNPKIDDIKRIQGNGLTDLEAFVGRILLNPKDGSAYPKEPKGIFVNLKNGDKTMLQHRFKIEYK